MPPKTVVSNDAFLAACIKHAKEKVVVNFESLARELGMSVGGAANKFRTIIKQLEEQGAPWANKDSDVDNATVSSSPSAKAKVPGKTKAAGKRKRNAEDDAVDSAGDSGIKAEDQSDGEPPKKKAKARTTKARGKPTPAATNTSNHDNTPTTAVASTTKSEDLVELPDGGQVAQKGRKRAAPKEKEPPFAVKTEEAKVKDEEGDASRCPLADCDASVGAE